MKYLLSWLNDRPDSALRDRFNAQPEAEEYVKSFFPQAAVLKTSKPDAVLSEVFYVWKSVVELQAGKPHLATITPIALGDTLQIDAAFAHASLRKPDAE